MARGSTWFKVKRDKLRKQIMALPKTPPTYQTIAAANTARDEANTLVAYTFNGAVVHGTQGKTIEPQGKGKRALDTRTYGNFKHAGRVGLLLGQFSDDYQDDAVRYGSVLIRNGKIIG
jgi:hypothetical protein